MAWQTALLHRTLVADAQWTDDYSSQGGTHVCVSHLDGSEAGDWLQALQGWPRLCTHLNHTLPRRCAGSQRGFVRYIVFCSS